MFNLILSIPWFILGLICLVVVIREHEKKKRSELIILLSLGLLSLVSGVYHPLEFL